MYEYTEGHPQTQYNVDLVRRMPTLWELDRERQRRGQRLRKETVLALAAIAYVVTMGALLWAAG
jgi:hypothetical protein